MSILCDPKQSPADVQVLFDASGSRGGVDLCIPHWFHFNWPPALEPTSIQVKELIPVVMAVALYGRFWRGKLIVFSVDNLAVVHILNRTHSKESHLMQLVRLLAFCASYYDFWFRAEHIPGKNNILADALSRYNIDFFISQAPYMQSQPTKVPLSLLSLVAPDKEWTSTPWMELFRCTLRLV